VRVDLLLQRWIDTLAALVLSLLDAWRSRRVLAIAREKDSFVVREGAPSESGDVDTAVVAKLAKGAPASAGLIRHARQRLVTLELSEDDIVRQRITVPVRARDFLAGIVRNQIDRLSPWPGDQVFHGFTATTDRDDHDVLDVGVLMASRSTVDAARAELAAAGVTIDRVVAREQTREPRQPVVLWSRLDSGSDVVRAGMRRNVAVTLIALFAVASALTAWAQISAAAIRTDSEEAAARSGILQRQFLQSHGGALTTSRDPFERAWILKATSASSVMILEALSRILPDTAFVTELSLQNATVRIVGMTNDAPSLIEPLEKSAQFADVHFFAPTTRAGDGTSFVFHIEGRVTPVSLPTEK